MRVIYLALGWYFHRKYQKRVRAVGAFAVAKQLRKQGVDLRVARLVVAYRPIPVLHHVVDWWIRVW